MAFFCGLAFIAAGLAGFTAGSWWLALALLPLAALLMIALSSLSGGKGRFVARAGVVQWTAHNRQPVYCRAWLALPGLVGFRDPRGVRHWVFRDEMTREHWRRLCLVARFARENRVGGSG